MSVYICKEVLWFFSECENVSIYSNIMHELTCTSPLLNIPHKMYKESEDHYTIVYINETKVEEQLT